jgi:hypothetical protein
MVPVVMAIILGLIYGLGEVFNLFSGVGHKDRSQQNTDFPAPGFPGVVFSSSFLFSPFVLSSYLSQFALGKP